MTERGSPVAHLMRIDRAPRLAELVRTGVLGKPTSETRSRACAIERVRASEPASPRGGALEGRRCLLASRTSCCVRLGMRSWWPTAGLGMPAAPAPTEGAARIHYSSPGPPDRPVPRELSTGRGFRLVRPATASTLVDMTTPIDAPSLTDDARLIEHFAPILDVANRRQLWIFFLDEDDRSGGIAIPIDDYPADPELLVTTADLGRRSAAELFGIRFAGLMREAQLAKIVLAWERPGGRLIDPQTRDWARAFGGALRAEGACLRAQLLLHDGGLRVLTPDDLV